MRSYKTGGAVRPERFPGPEIRGLVPAGRRRMGANPHANGGFLKKALRLPTFGIRIQIEKPGQVEVGNTHGLWRIPARRDEIEREQLSHLRPDERQPPTNST